MFAMNSFSSVVTCIQFGERNQKKLKQRKRNLGQQLLKYVYKKVFSLYLKKEQYILIYDLDLAELDIPDTIQLDFPDPSHILKFNVSIHPDEGNRLYYLIIMLIHHSI